MGALKTSALLSISYQFHDGILFVCYSKKIMGQKYKGGTCE